MTKNEIKNLQKGDKLFRRNQILPYKVVQVVNSPTLGSGLDLETPGGYYQFVNNSELEREFEILAEEKENG